MNHALIFSSRSSPWERNSGAHRIATYLRKHEMNVEVVDFAPFWELELLKEFTRRNVTSKTLFFGFSIFFSFWNQNMRDFTAWVKLTYPHIKTVAGGQNVLQANLNDIDIWVDSYGEEAMLALAKKLAGSTTSGIIFAPEFFGQRKVIKALQAYPSYNMGDYSVIMEDRDFLEPWEWLTVTFSRGCKFACSFCNFPVLGVKEDTSSSAKSFEYEMYYNYDKFGINRYYVADETFNDRVEKISKFADVTERLDFNPFFSGFIRADLLSQPNMIEELARMNFGGQYYGIETFNHQSGKMIGKGLDPEKVKSLILKSKDYFKNKGLTYKGTVSLIVGLPFDTAEDWDSNMHWLKENWSSESISVFPLFIEDLSIMAEHIQTNASKFSKNLQKYGLRSMGSKEIERHFDSSEEYFNWRSAFAPMTPTIWEHDTMNYFQAMDIADRVKESMMRDFTLDSWSLSWPEIRERKKLDNLSNILNLTKGESYPHQGIFDSFIKSYSLKKIFKLKKL